MEIYNHKQIGHYIIVIFLLTIVFSTAINIYVLVTYHLLIFLFLICFLDLFFLGFLLTFNSLVIIIYEDGNLIVKFGLIKKKLNLKNAISCEKVINQWYRYGIKLMPNGGWLYNISGNLAVEINFNDGKIYRIGTDEPEYLILIIKKFIIGENLEIKN